MKQIKAMRILGVDPGTNVLGYAIVEVFQKQLRMIGIGTVRMDQKASQPEKLKQIFDGVQAVIRKYKPDHMAIEAPFYGNNVQSMLKLGRAQGVSIAAAMNNDVAVTEYSPKKIKQSITGSGNSSKEQVSAMLEQILRVKLKEQPLDATDGLATAVCHYFQSSSPLSGTKRYSGWDAFLKDNPDRTK